MAVTRAPFDIAAPVRVEEIQGWRDFLSVRDAWQNLARSDEDGLLLGHDWVAQSWKSSIELLHGERPCILGVRGGAGWEGFVALRHDPHKRKLSFLADGRSQRLDLIGLRDGHGWTHVAKYLRARRDWDWIDLIYLREASARAILAMWPGLGLAVRKRGRVIQRRLDLRRPWALVEADFSPYLRANMRRRYKKLEARGAVGFEECCGGPGLMRLLGECFALEQRGWKGARGTAILDDAGRHRFYRQLAARLTWRNEFRLYCLRVGGRLAAFEYCAANRDTRRLSSVKIAYDEGLRGTSPGVVLRWLLLQRAQREFDAYEFLGEDATWKREWTSGMTELIHLRAFNRTLRGRARRWRAQTWARLRACCAQSRLLAE